MQPLEELKTFFEKILMDNETETINCIETLRSTSKETIDNNRQLFLKSLENLTAILPPQEPEANDEISQVEIIKELVGGNDIRRLNQAILSLKVNVEKNSEAETELLNNAIIALINDSEAVYQRLQQKADMICQNLFSLLENQHHRHIYRQDTQAVFNETAQKIFPQ